FVAVRPRALWLHWGMRGPLYGFEVLFPRARLHGLRPTEIPLQQRFDLAGYLKRRYGDDYVPHPRLWHALHANGLAGPGLLSEAQTAAAWTRAEYAAVLASLVRKVAGITDLYERVCRGTFQSN